MIVLYFHVCKWKYKVCDKVPEKLSHLPVVFTHPNFYNGTYSFFSEEIMFQRYPIIAKVILFHLIFIAVHYVYDWFPSPLTFFLGATNESVYQHMKAIFHAYFLFSAFEYGLAGKTMFDKPRFLYARFLGLVLMPLLILPFFLLGPALFVKIESIPLEIIFANLALAGTSASTFLLVDVFEHGKFTSGAKWALFILVFLTIIEFSIFNYRLPWFDVFANPPGW